MHKSRGDADGVIYAVQPLLRKKLPGGDMATLIINEIEAERVRLGLSMERLSKLAGYDRHYWGHVMRGSWRPSFDAVANYAEAAGMKLDLVASNRRGKTDG